MVSSRFQTHLAPGFSLASGSPEGLRYNFEDHFRRLLPRPLALDPERTARVARRHDRARHSRRTDAPPVARMARKAPRVEPWGLAPVLQEPHGRKVDPVRGLAARSAVLRLDRQLDQASG